MMGTAFSGGTAYSPSSARVFVYEVAGLRQNEETTKTNYQIRHSSNVFIKVPYNQMNREMQRITRMGGQIVSIKPLDAAMNGSSSAGGKKE
jgi:sulfite reductase alpha subunit-like flavoprotein